MNKRSSSVPSTRETSGSAASARRQSAGKGAPPHGSGSKNVASKSAAIVVFQATIH